MFSSVSLDSTADITGWQVRRNVDHFKYKLPTATKSRNFGGRVDYDKATILTRFVATHDRGQVWVGALRLEL